ncbi:unnamed protein product, partial [Darwinula stevensoni]
MFSERQDFVGCAWGIRYIGYMMACFHAANSSCSFLSGWLVKYVDRLYIFIFAGLLHASTLLALFFWHPSPDHAWAFFVVAGAWGICDAVWQAQVNGLLGVLSKGKEKEAFSAYKVTESLGFVVAFFISSRLCTVYKLSLLVAFLVLGMIAYFILEYIEAKSSRETKLKKEDRCMKSPSHVTKRRRGKASVREPSASGREPSAASGKELRGGGRSRSGLSFRLSSFSVLRITHQCHTAATVATVMTVETGTDDDVIRRKKRVIWKNVLVVSTSFLLLFLSFSTVSNLQSSINARHGLGTASLVTVYGFLVFSSLFLTTFAIERLTAKWTIFACSVVYLGFIAAQFEPTAWTLLPSAAAVGLAAAPLWSAKCTYLTVAGDAYAEVTGQERQAVIMRFFGVFFMLFQGAGIFGNLVSSTVLGIGSSGGRNTTRNVEEMCGVNFCESAIEENENLERPDEKAIQILSGTLVAVACLSSGLVAFFLDPLHRLGGRREESSGADGGMQFALATLRQLKTPRQALISFLVFFGGLEQGFLGSDYTKDFVGCAWGIRYIGYMMACFHAANSSCSFLSGWLVKYVDRLYIFIFAGLLHASTLLALFFWHPSPDHAWAFFVVAGAWGICDAVWQAQVNGLLGVLSKGKEKEAFSAYKVTESLGFVVAFFISSRLCTVYKLSLLVAFLVLGMIAYFILEYIEAKSSRETKVEENPLKAATSTIDNDVTFRSLFDREARRTMEARKEKRRIWKNNLIISFSFVLLFFSYSTVGNLQSTINAEHGLGTTSLSVLYTGLVLSSLFLTTVSLKTLSPKWTIFLCCLLYVPYMGAQFYPTAWTLIPSAVVIGMAAAPLWSAKCTYLTVAGNAYAELSREEKGVVITRFFGVFFMLFQVAGVLGNVISSVGLVTWGSNEKQNYTQEVEEDVSRCGVNFCEEEVGRNENLARPNEQAIHIISGIAMSMPLIAAALVAFFLDPLQRTEEEKDDSKPKIREIFTIAMSTIMQFKQPYQALLSLAIFFGGVEQGFITSDYTKDFVGCAWGIRYIGYMMACFHAANSSCSFLSGWLVKYVDRLYIFIFAGLLHASTLL